MKFRQRDLDNMFLLVEVSDRRMRYDSDRFVEVRENKFCSNDIDKLRQRIIQEYHEIKEFELDELLFDASVCDVLHNGDLVDLYIEDVEEV